jgi:hypothetical protein
VPATVAGRRAFAAPNNVLHRTRRAARSQPTATMHFLANESTGHSTTYLRKPTSETEQSSGHAQICRRGCPLSYAGLRCAVSLQVRNEIERRSHVSRGGWARARWKDTATFTETVSAAVSRRARVPSPFAGIISALGLGMCSAMRHPTGCPPSALSNHFAQPVTTPRDSDTRRITRQKQAPA